MTYSKKNIETQNPVKNPMLHFLKDLQSKEISDQSYTKDEKINFFYISIIFPILLNYVFKIVWTPTQLSGSLFTFYLHTLVTFISSYIRTKYTDRDPPQKWSLF